MFNSLDAYISKPAHRSALEFYPRLLLRRIKMLLPKQVSKGREFVDFIAIY
jgi:hypothetical protein